MNLRKLFMLMIFSAAVALAAPPAQATANVTLNDSIKASLLAAQPVLGKKVEQETFDGKPVLVVFFASW